MAEVDCLFCTFLLLGGHLTIIMLLARRVICNTVSRKQLKLETFCLMLRRWTTGTLAYTGNQLMRNMSRMILRFWSWKGKTLIITWNGKVNDLQICWCRKFLRNKKKKLKKRKQSKLEIRCIMLKRWKTVKFADAGNI